MVATRARSGVTSPEPSGWRRFDRKMTNTRLAGSIQIEVPVNPVWPNDPSGKNSPRFAEYDESTSQPKPRTFGSPAGVAGDVMRLTVSGARIRAVDRAAAEQHAAVEREIRRRAEEPRVPGHAAHPPRGRIVHDAAQHLHLGPPFDSAHDRLARIAERRAGLGRRDARDHRRRRIEHRLPHPERQEHALADELLERLLAHAADDLGKQEIVDVAVDEAAARRRGQHFFRREANRFVVAAPVEADIDVRSETGHVRQKIAHRDAVLAVLGEIRNERGDRIGEPDLAFFHQHHHRRRGRDDFRERRDVEDRVERHRLARGLDRATAVRLAQHDRVAAADDDDGAGELAFLDGVGDDVIEAGEAGEIEASRLRWAEGRLRPARSLKTRSRRRVRRAEARPTTEARQARSRTRPLQTSRSTVGISAWIILAGSALFARLNGQTAAHLPRPIACTNARLATAGPAHTVAGLALLVVGLAGGLWWWTRDGSPAGRFILISIDTLRADRFPVYGYSKARRRRSTRSRSDAIVFDHAYAHAPQTLPSHASMFTGLLPFEHGVRDNLGFTLATGEGHAAGIAPAGGLPDGRVRVVVRARSETGLARGFDVYSAEFPEAAADRSPALVQRPGEQTLAAATRWLDTLADKRFFLFFHIYEPHKPYAPPARFEIDGPYDGEVAYSDEIVGRLLQDLKRRGWYDHAAVIVHVRSRRRTGDHGELEHGLFVYDEVIRVPWIMKLPASRSAGGQIAAPIQHIDLFPTILASARLPLTRRCAAAT